MCACGQPTWSISRAHVAASSATLSGRYPLFVRTQMPSIGQRRQVGKLLDQRSVPRHERAGVHKHDTFTVTAVVEFVGHLDVIEVQAVHGAPPVN